MEQLRDHVLDPEIVEGAVQDVLAELQPASGAAEAAREALLRELREAELVQARPIDAIATVGDVTPLAVRLKQQEAGPGPN